MPGLGGVSTQGPGQHLASGKVQHGKCFKSANQDMHEEALLPLLGGTCLKEIKTQSGEHAQCSELSALHPILLHSKH